MQRIVIDTNVVLSGLLWREPPHFLLTQFDQHRGIQLFSSPSLLNELADVLTRPSIAKRLHLINKKSPEVLADYILAVTVLAPKALAKPVCRDPDDDEVLALALWAQADVIISGDEDLLTLQSFEGIPIITAAQALHQLKVGG